MSQHGRKLTLGVSLLVAQDVLLGAEEDKD